MGRNCLECAMLECSLCGQSPVATLENGEMRISGKATLVYVVRCTKWGWECKHTSRSHAELGAVFMTCDKWKEQDERVQ